MQSFNIYMLCNRIPTLNRSLNRQIHSSICLYQKKYFKQKAQSDIGIRHEKQLYGEDYPNEIDEEGEIEFNFMKNQDVYEENLRQKNIDRQKLARAMAKASFIAPRKQPSMLTHAEKEYIRYLHKIDPENWNIKSLSEGFPATPEIIRKILRAHWKPSPEKIKKQDLVVEKNWKLLEEGKLDADPNLIAHLQKFTTKRKAFPDKVVMEQFLLKQNKNEKIYNNGEMSKILEYYEEKFHELAEKSAKEIEVKQLTDGMVPENNLPTNINKEKSAMNILNRKIEKSNKYNNFEEKESFTLGLMLSQYQKETTLENLEKNILVRAESNKKLSLYDKAVLESKLNENKLDKENFIKNSFKISGDSVIKIQSSSKEKVQEEILKDKLNCKSFQKKPEKLSSESKHNFTVNKENENVNVKDDNTQYADELQVGKLVNSLKKEGTIQTEKVDVEENSTGLDSEQEKRFYSKEEELIKQTSKPEKRASESKHNSTINEENENENLKDDNTQYVDELQIGKLLNSLKKEDTIQTGKVDVEENSIKLDSEEDDSYYDEEVESFKQTSFWESGRDSRAKALAESKKPLLKVQHNSKKFSENNIFMDGNYPMKIYIPKDKRGSGLTFKVNDCYYDDDGEFLYRVPGMVK